MKPVQIRTRMSTRRAQRGFGMAIALAVIAVFALIAGAIALANKGGSQKTDLETAKVMAQSIIQRGNDIYTAVTRVAADRDIKKMDFTNASVAGTSFGLYDPAIGVAKEVEIPSKAMATGVDTAMTLDKTNIKVNGIGVNGAAEIAIAAVLVDVTTQTCQLINKTIYNADIDDAVPTVSSATAIDKAEGCALIASKNTYYKVLGSSV